MTIFNVFLFSILGVLRLIVAAPVLLFSVLGGRLRSPGGRSARRPCAGFRPHKDSREGEVTVSGQDATAGEKIVGDHVGEYVDYEEVDERK